MSKLHKIVQEVYTLTLAQLYDLDEWIHSRIEALEAEQKESASQREVVPGSQRKVGAMTYQLELVRCGKERCHCATGKGHGPYWYGYWSSGGKTRSKYIGKELPHKGQRAAGEKSAATKVW